MTEERIRPAVYREQAKSFAAKPPWKVIAAVLVVVALAIGLYSYRKWRRVENFRTALLAEFEEKVLGVEQKSRSFEEELLRRFKVADKGAAQRFASDSFSLLDARDAGIVYARLRSPVLNSRERSLAAVMEQNNDALGACLGISMLPAKDALGSVDVLDETWLTDAQNSTDLMRLRVRQEQLSRAQNGELKPVTDALGARYLMLFVVQGKSRLDDPVDVFVWDRPSNKLMLRVRTEANGKLIPVRNRVGGDLGKRIKKIDDPIAAADCSIASQVKGSLRP